MLLHNVHVRKCGQEAYLPHENVGEVFKLQIYIQDRFHIGGISALVVFGVEASKLRISS